MSLPTLRREEEDSGSELEYEEQHPRQVFVDQDGHAICFMIHSTVKDPFKRENLRRDIEV